jgi:hypothetical protein
MSAPITFYLQQVENCAKSAEGAVLPNLRIKYLDAQAAWQELADRAIVVEAERAKRDAAKGERALIED